MTTAHLLPLMVAVPLGAAFIIPIAGLARERSAAWVALASSAVILAMAIMLSGKEIVYQIGGWGYPFGINLVADPLSGFFHLLIAAVNLLVVVYAMSYMKAYTAPAKFYTLYMLMIAGMNGVTASGDLFNMYVFLEVAALSSYSLVAFGVGHEELEAAFKYLVLGSMASSVILFAIALTYSMTGTLNLGDVSRTVQQGIAPVLVLFVTALFIGGYSLKASLVPFHAWLPDAHPSAPAPISALLSGLLIKVLGVYCIIRLLFNVFGMTPAISNVLITLGLLSMTVGALLALGQSDFKRLLAYSSISQVGYIVFAFGIGTPLAIVGGLLHLLNHAFVKSLLFLCSGAVEYATGTRDMKKLGGLWRRLPVTAVTCSIASLSISAVPPMGGFFSKFIIILAAVEAASLLGPVAYVYAAITALVSFMTLTLFIKVQKTVLFGDYAGETGMIRPVPVQMRVVLIVMAVCCIVFGLACPFFVSRLIEPAGSVLFDRAGYIMQVLQ